MTYISGTITNSDPGPTLHTAMATALTSSGFTLVDTVVIATKTHKVWKSPAANNAANLDWFLDISYNTTGAAALGMAPFEFYDPATDLGYRGPYVALVATIDATTSSRYGATGYALETNWSALNANNTTPLPTTAFAYWISITGDRVIMLNSNDPTFLMCTGMYLPDALYAARAGAALYPLVQAKVSTLNAATSTNGAVSLTRIPPATVIISNGWYSHARISLISVNSPYIPTGSSVSYPTHAVPLMITQDGGVASANTPIVTYGQLRDLAVTNTSGVVRGDTVTIASAPWVLTSTNANASLLFKAA